MSKSNAGRYLDENKTLLYTANNLCKYALQNLKNINILNAQKESLTPLAIANYLAVKSKLTQALLFGNIEACAGLAYFNREGIGGTKNPYNEKLFLTIGSKFGHPACIQALQNLQNNNYDVEKEANIWVNHINTYERDLNKEITTPELAANSVFLKNDLTKNGISLDAYNAHILIAKSEAEIAETFEPATNQANYQNTTTTTYTPPPEKPKDKSKVTGDHKHDLCDIL